MYNHSIRENLNVRVDTESSSYYDFPVLREVKAAVKFLKKNKAAGIENIPAELIIYSGESVIDMLTIICNKFWQSGKWSTTWTQSLSITV